MNRRRVAPRLLALALCLTLAIGLIGPARALADNEPLPDYPVAGGHYYSQAGGGNNRGYAITDADGAPFFTAFRALGGVEALGYPSSRRFEHGGFLSQATQKAVLQWRPDFGEIVLANVLDDLDKMGRNGALRAQRLVPEPIHLPVEPDQTIERIVERRFALLGTYPAIRAAYFAADRPVERFGLPTSAAVDLGDVVVLRAQRAVLQLWEVDTPWAKAGQVVFANVGDLAKEFGLVPERATVAEEPARIVVAGAIPRLTLSAERESRVLAVADAAEGAVVQVLNVGLGTGSGIVVDATRGVVVTNSHVVRAGRRFRVVCPDGVSVAATLLGDDPLSDLAVLGVPPSSRPSLRFGDSDRLLVGSTVLALGFPPALPREPALSVGEVRGFYPTRPPLSDRVRHDMVLNDAPLFPGDSGGPLIALDGTVIGVNTAIVQRRGMPSSRTSVAIASNIARPLVEELVARGRVRRAYLGITPETVTSSLAGQLSLAVRSGVYVASVEDDSPAGRAGIRRGDVIVRFDGYGVDDVFDLRAILEAHRAGDLVSLVVVRGGERVALKITLADRP